MPWTIFRPWLQGNLERAQLCAFDHAGCVRRLEQRERDSLQHRMQVPSVSGVKRVCDCNTE